MSRPVLLVCFGLILTSSCSQEYDFEPPYFTITIELEDSDEFIGAKATLIDLMESRCGLLVERRMLSTVLGRTDYLYLLQSRWPEGTRTAGHFAASGSFDATPDNSTYRLEVSLFESGFIDVASVRKCHKAIEERIDLGFRHALMEPS